MNKFFLSTLLFCITLGTKAQTREDVNIIPVPAELQVNRGYFQFDPSSTTIRVEGKEAKSVAEFFNNKIFQSTGYKLKKGKKDSDNNIYLCLDESIKGTETYSLQVTPQHIIARASTSTGLFYAMQSLLQLMPAEVENKQAGSLSSCEIPALEINDEPRFAYRGIMLDVCRHFLPIEEVKKQIDVLSSYKINRLHWHLTEDQGWRIEIKKYPELTQIGSKRTEGDGSIYEGYYTQEQIKDVVAYAQERHIEVVPELEMPGHELAAIATYPELSCRQQPTTPRIIGGVEDIVMCPGKENMFEFLQGVIDELVPLFPSKYFHIGGDESPRGEWAKCPDCQNRMKALGYTQEAQLQSYIIGRMEKYLRSKGKCIIGWDEILEGGNLDTTAIVMSWRGEEGGITAAKAGHQVLMTPGSHGLYFDHFQGDAITEPMCAIGGYAPINQVYSYNPVPEVLHKAGRDNMVLGVQANCWSEYMLSPQIVEFRLYPRALALAEVAWSRLDRKDFNDFQRRLDNDASLRLQYRNINFQIPQPEQVNGSLQFMAFEDTDTLKLKTTRPLPIVYTTDGTKPTPHSMIYTAPIVVDRSTIVRTATLLPNNIMSPIRTIYMDKMAPKTAVKLKDKKPGLLVNKWDGYFLRPSAVQGNPVVKDSVVAEIEALRALTHVPNNVRNVKDYAATVEGYVDIPETGIYEFATNNVQLFIDGNVVIDNSNIKVLRHCPTNRQLNLAKGLHQIKVVFLGGIYHFWPTYWDDAQVKFRPENGEWKKISKEMLWH